MATFACELEGLPTAEIGGQALPRQLGQRHYTGVGLWNSRSANLLTALRAMLGDDAAYVETPHFTVRRLQLRHGKGTSAYRAALADKIYPSRTHGGWGGYRPFIAAAAEIDAHAEAVAAERNASTASDAAAVSALRRAARGSNAAAAHLARALIDRIFTAGDDGGRAYRTSMLRTLNEYADVAAEQPHDSLVLWSTVYPWVAARFYGPSTIVYEPDVHGRGADLNYIGELNRTGVDVGSHHRAGKVIRSCENKLEALNAHGMDAGQVVTPGYAPPSDVAGFELRDENDQTWWGNCARIELGFYKVPDGAGGNLVAIAAPLRRRHHRPRPDCITRASPSRGSRSRARPARLYRCAPAALDSTCVPDPVRVSADESTVHVAAVLVAIGDAWTATEQLAACERARAALGELDPGDAGPRLAEFPRIVAAVGATRVGCDRRVLTVEHGQVCEALLSAHHNRTRPPAGFTTSVPTRLGWEYSRADDGWRGAVPDEWARLVPADPC